MTEEFRIKDIKNTSHNNLKLMYGLVLEGLEKEHKIKEYDDGLMMCCQCMQEKNWLILTHQYTCGTKP